MRKVLALLAIGNALFALDIAFELLVVLRASKIVMQGVTIPDGPVLLVGGLLLLVGASAGFLLASKPESERTLIWYLLPFCTVIVYALLQVMGSYATF